MGNKKPVRSTALELTLRISARGPKEITAVEHSGSDTATEFRESKGLGCIESGNRLFEEPTD